MIEEVNTRTRICSSRVNLKTRLNTPWKQSVDKNTKENSNNMMYKSADIIRKFHICQSTTHLADSCPRKARINETDIEKEPDVEKDDDVENSDDISSIFSESLKDIENINATFDIMESYSHFPQLRNGQLDLSKIQDEQLINTKPNRGKGYTAGSSCITEVVIDNKHTKLLLDPQAFCSCVGKFFLKTCVPNFEDKLFPIDVMKLNESEISLYLTDKQESELSTLLYDHKEALASEKEPLAEIIIGHEVDIILNIERPYPPLLRRPAYLESPKSREALEIHIKERLALGVIRKVGHHEEVEITTSVIVAWRSISSRIVGDFIALNT
ncbi:hypothetical protein O181_081007 [Austropuccinia psidii MF-1]|uniref:Reverse transcriptase domain-containing protein n=1 Tax=Austropuccinia psidii MF-1 TaxID=1389203 RepID=A0A9Q3FPX3_9BASI|nr:hypothetical protein [Austropuccinia psidii MF-1]